MTELEKIYDLLPDNTTREISEKDLRDSFTVTFDYHAKYFYKVVPAEFRNSNYVITGDGSVKPAGDLGKNVANSSLTSVVGAGLTLGANWTFNTQGFYYYIKSLPDKSSDTNFTRFRLQDSNGQEAYASNIYNALLSSFNQFSAAQSLALSQLLNGGAGSGGAINVNLISPPIIQNSFDSVEYVLLRGVNLNLNVLSMGIQILASDKTTVVANIPNNQIQLNASGTELVFYYNFYQFSEGQFFIKIISGSRTYISTLDINIVDMVENINMNNITWDVQYASGITPNIDDVAQGGNFNLIQPAQVNQAPRLNVKSSEIFSLGENFYVEMKLTILSSLGNGSTGGFRSFFGIGYSDTPNIPAISSLINTSFSKVTGNDYLNVDIFNNENYVIQQNSTSVIYTVVFIKTGNLFRTIVGASNTSITLSNNSGYSIFLNIAGYTNSSQSIQGQVVKAFKFN